VFPVPNPIIQQDVVGVSGQGIKGMTGAAVRPQVAKEELPAYAVPLFVRLLPKQETTGTFKLMKAKYRSEGIDPEKVTDALFWLDPDTRKYQPFNKAVYESIKTGKAKI
jgi:hypothetical protein